MAKGARKLQSSTQPANKNWQGAGALLAKSSGVIGVCLLVLLAIVGSLNFFTNEKTQATKKVVITGELTYLPKAQIEQILSRKLNSSFYALDLEAIRNALLDQPWIKSAQVTRRWPYQLIVTVTEQTPVAMWGEYQLINAQGQLFAHQGFYDGAKLTQLSASEEKAGEVLRQYRLLSSQLSRREIEVNSLKLSDAGTWSAMINDDVLLMIGHTDIVNRVKNLERVLDTGLEHQISQINRIDLRHKDSVAVQWKVQLERSIASS